MVFISVGSHRKRDNRCGIAAPKLEHGEEISVVISLYALTLSQTAFIKALEAHGWEADIHLEHPELTYGPALEDATELNPDLESDDDDVAVDCAMASIELEQEVSALIPLELLDSGYAEPALSQTTANHGRTTTNGIQKVALPPPKRGPTMTTTSSGTTGAIPISRDRNGVKHIPKSNMDTENVARKTTIAHRLKESASSKRALIVKVSHIGGHKYAGNAIVRFLPF